MILLILPVDGQGFISLFYLLTFDKPLGNMATIDKNYKVLKLMSLFFVARSIIGLGYALLGYR